MTLKVTVNDLHFQYQLRVSHDAYLVQIWWFQLKFVTSYRADKIKFTDRRPERPKSKMMCETNNKSIKGPPNYICIPNLKKNPPITSMFSHANESP